MTTRSTSRPGEDLAWTTWRKSSRSSDSGNGQCVEVRANVSGRSPAAFQVRDSKLAEDSPALDMTTADLTALLRRSRRD
jgi:hypothetical protein